MTIIQNAKAFLFKKGFDFDKPDITLQLFHPQLQVFFAVNGIFFNNRESKIRFVWPLLSSILSLIANSFEMMFIWHGVTTKDYGFATECFCYFFILGSVVVVYVSMLMNREKIFTLSNNMNKDFILICSLGSQYSFPIFIATLYISNTLVYLLYQSTIATQDEHMVRPFMFPLWLPADDPHRTPNYEIFFLLEVILIFVVLCTFVLYVYILFHLLLHYYNLMDIILIAFGELFDDLDESVATRPPEDPRRQEVQAKLNRRMGQIARWHHSVFDGWHGTQLGRLLRRDFVIFIQRSQEPLAIKFTALPHLQLETFSSREWDRSCTQKPRHCVGTHV
ncbi:hypothetical protein MSG28_002756 [Choristoneura fumiferana]|uniref:Uncharacterized protein n=1 Tax=Choristoneura fumiferana TaxID=7141 RepID=A0ACC0JJ21_CHOFU|nr:hypothetical protein MSG28_002756 [Choristoneura fumiferana]